jgi:hypothetical protein
MSRPGCGILVCLLEPLLATCQPQRGLDAALRHQEILRSSTLEPTSIVRIQRGPERTGGVHLRLFEIPVGEGFQDAGTAASSGAESLCLGELKGVGTVLCRTNAQQPRDSDWRSPARQVLWNGAAMKPHSACLALV